MSEEVFPRFEFRTFGKNFSDVSKKMAEISVLKNNSDMCRFSSEIYFVSKNIDNFNIKIRDAKLDIKKKIQIIDGLEQWNPVVKTDFPISINILKSDFFSFNKNKLSTIKKNLISELDFKDILTHNDDYMMINVSKKRTAFNINNTICEFCEVEISGIKLQTISSESTEISDILKTMKQLKINHLSNINYVKAIKTVIGWNDITLAN